MIRSMTLRRARMDRWIASLTPLFEVIEAKASRLDLGGPSANVGPTFMAGDRFPDGRDRVRRGAVWFVRGKNCGFHVDFLCNGIVIEAWTGKDRRTTTTIFGKVTSLTLRRDLSVCLVAAGLTDLARTEHVRDNLFTQRVEK